MSLKKRLEKLKKKMIKDRNTRADIKQGYELLYVSSVSRGGFYPGDEIKGGTSQNKSEVIALWPNIRGYEAVGKPIALLVRRLEIKSDWVDSETLSSYPDGKSQAGGCGMLLKQQGA